MCSPLAYLSASTPWLGQDTAGHSQIVNPSHMWALFARALLDDLYARVINETCVDLHDFSGKPIDPAPFAGAAGVRIAFDCRE